MAVSSNVAYFRRPYDNMSLTPHDHRETVSLTSLDHRESVTFTTPDHMETATESETSTDVSLCTHRTFVCTPFNHTEITTESETKHGP